MARAQLLHVPPQAPFAGVPSFSRSSPRCGVVELVNHRVELSFDAKSANRVRGEAATTAPPLRTRRAHNISDQAQLAAEGCRWIKIAYGTRAVLSLPGLPEL